MDAEARRAVTTIRGCVQDGRYRFRSHFEDQMNARGMYWTDILLVLDRPEEVNDDGWDRFDRPKWRIYGHGWKNEPVEIVCALGFRAGQSFAHFITLYFGRGRGRGT